MSYTPWRANDRVVGGKSMQINFEQRSRQGMKAAIYSLPSQDLVYNLGFSSLERTRLEKIVRQYADDVMQQASETSN